MRFLMMALRGLGRLCGATVASGVGLFDWAFRWSWQGLTGRSLDAERAERVRAQADADTAAQAAAQAQADRQDAQTRHEESATLAEAQLEATRELRDELRRAEVARKAEARRPKAEQPVAPPTAWEPDKEPEGSALAPADA
ncbi:hypothetical protein [Lichenibacterium dinghuense]|uniref:hypothetical protein n=1 Tax=Lichenibacterium dinghuense TaxID=2895977 RepID=UPI001F436DB7|nr:hypothetical protein [Lichenibacterium sp. 6Y81]